MSQAMSMWMAGAIAIGALIVLWLIVRQVQGRSRTVAWSATLWAGRDYMCPQCGRAMAPGWVLLGRGAIWSPVEKGPPGSFAHIGMALPNTISLAFRPATNLAWRCPDCQILLVDHSRLVRSKPRLG